MFSVSFKSIFQTFGFWNEFMDFLWINILLKIAKRNLTFKYYF